MHHYHVNGVGLVSEYPLRTLPRSNARPDIVISAMVGEPAPSAQLYCLGGPEPVLVVETTAGGYLVRSAIGDFFISRSSIACPPPAASVEAHLEQVLVDQILPRAMQLIGKPCFHASAALVGGRAVAFAGDSGAGKLTLCAALAKRGKIVSDDSLALRVTTESIDAWPGYPSLRLWPPSAEAVTGDASKLEPAFPLTPKLRLPAELVAEPAPLAHFFLLERGEGPPHVDRLAPRDAFTALSRCLHRLAPDDPEAMRAEFHLLGEVSARVPVSRLSYAHDFATLPALVERITSLVTETGSP